MIIDDLASSQRYERLHPGFAAAFAFLRKKSLMCLAPGKYLIGGENIYAVVSEGKGRSRKAAKLEAHKKYIDIQYCLAGKEEMGWRALADCVKPLGRFDSKKDFMLYKDKVDTWAVVKPGEFVIFFPSDAHAPLVGTGRILKVVIKVKV